MTRAGALLALAALSATAGEPAGSDLCPEECGTVLKTCFEESRKRHECMALTDACLQACRAGERVVDEAGGVVPDWRYREGDERTRVRW